MNRQPDRAWLTAVATSLTGVDGVVGVLLGGSRARGDHSPDSDVDLGVYYRPPLDVEALTELARQIASARESGGLVTVTRPGDWGPWVDGGAWLSIDGVPVDWIYRDLDRVHAAWTDACAGRYRFHVQAGHPLGVPDFAYAGEVGLGTVLADPTGELTGLHARTQDYPPALAEALVDGLWEARFLVAGARKAAARTDTAWIAGCLFRAVGGLRACPARPRRPVAGQREGRGPVRRRTSRVAGGLRPARARAPRRRWNNSGRTGSVPGRRRRTHHRYGSPLRRRMRPQGRR